jgi:hypothetical protein
VTLPATHHTKGTVEFAWQPQGSFLATCGQNRIVNIFNRQGEAQAEIPLTSGNGCALAALAAARRRRFEHGPVRSQQVLANGVGQGRRAARCAAGGLVHNQAVGALLLPQSARYRQGS